MAPRAVPQLTNQRLGKPMVVIIVCCVFPSIPSILYQGVHPDGLLDAAIEENVRRGIAQHRGPPCTSSSPLAGARCTLGSSHASRARRPEGCIWPEAPLGNEGQTQLRAVAATWCAPPSALGAEQQLAAATSRPQLAAARIASQLVAAWVMRHGSDSVG